MGKDFRHSKFSRQPKFLGKKNISKKNQDIKSREKSQQKTLRQTDREVKRKTEFQLRELALNKKNGVAQKRLEAKKTLERKVGNDDDVWQDVDEHERDVFDKDGYFDVLESEA